MSSIVKINEQINVLDYRKLATPSKIYAKIIIYADAAVV